MSVENILSICAILGGIISIITLLGYSKSIISYIKFLYVKRKILRFFVKYEVAITKIYLMGFLKLTSHQKDSVDKVLDRLYYNKVEMYIIGNYMYINKKSFDKKNKLVGYCIDSNEMYSLFYNNSNRYLNNKSKNTC